MSVWVLLCTLNTRNTAVPWFERPTRSTEGTKGGRKTEAQDAKKQQKKCHPPTTLQQRTTPMVKKYQKRRCFFRYKTYWCPHSCDLCERLLCSKSYSMLQSCWKGVIHGRDADVGVRGGIASNESVRSVRALSARIDVHTQEFGRLTNP